MFLLLYIKPTSFRFYTIQGSFANENFSFRTHINNHFYSLKEPAKDNLIQIYKIYPPVGYQCQKYFGLRPSLNQLLKEYILRTYDMHWLKKYSNALLINENKLKSIR